MHFLLGVQIVVLGKVECFKGGFFYFYSQNSDSSSSVEYGAKSLSHTGLGGDKDDGVSSSTLVGGEVIAVPKSIPVS